jgi:hypothetical protein
MTLEDFEVAMRAWQDAWLTAVERCQSTKEIKELELAFRKEKRALMSRLWQK